MLVERADADARPPSARGECPPWPPSSAPHRLKPTHEVTNQPPPLEGYNVFEQDRSLVEALRREGGDWADDRGPRARRDLRPRDAIGRGAQANENPPKLRTHDRFGNRIDEVEFHPAWHELMRRGGSSHGLHALAVARPAAGRPRGSGGDVHAPVAGRGRAWAARSR